MQLFFKIVKHTQLSKVTILRLDTVSHIINYKNHETILT